MRARTVALLAAFGAGALVAALASRRTRDPGPYLGDAPWEVVAGVFCVGPHGRTQTNAYLVCEGSAWVLVDAGWAADAARIRAAAVRLLGHSTVPAAILLTHAHPDHDGAARELAEAWGCPVLAHPDELAIARGDFAAMEATAGPLDRWLVLPLMRAVGRRRRQSMLDAASLDGHVRPLHPGGAVPGLCEWRWLHTPGHTPGHVAYVRERDRVALTGDALVTLAVNSPSGILAGRQELSGPPWYTTWDDDAAARSITTLADFEPDVVASGHGVPLAGPATAGAVRAFAAAG